MKSLKSMSKSMSHVDAPNTVNLAGGADYTQSDKEALRQYAMTGTINNSFYASQKELLSDAVELIKRAKAQDLYDAIVLGRNEGFIRAFPIVGLVYLSQKDSVLFKNAFEKVVITGNDLIDFIELCKGVRGFGRAVKTAINSWIKNKTNAYYAQKYRNQIADAIRISRFKGEDCIFAYVLSKYGDSVKGFKETRVKQALKKYPEIKANSDFQNAVNAGKLDKAVKILQDFKNGIDVDSLTSLYGRFDTAIWFEIARLSPTMRFLKYLDKFASCKVFDTPTGMELLKSKINVGNLQKAKVFPFRVYVAYKSVGNLNNKALNYLAEVLDDYTNKYDWSSFNKSSWAILPDVSGSMSSQIAKSDMRFNEVAGMFTGFFHKGLEDCRVIPWDTQVHDFRLPKGDSVMTHIKTIQNFGGGGTYMHLGPEYLLRNKIKVDFCIFITDTEHYGKNFAGAWEQYKKFNKNAQAFLLRLDSYSGTAPISERDAKRLGVYQIFGWNDNVVKAIEYFASK